MSDYALLNPEIFYSLPRSFDFTSYIEIERELWALFPETQGRRVNFCQTGLTAHIYVEVAEDGSELRADETYFLMPCADHTMRPLRMRPCRRLTLREYRMSHLTALKLLGRLQGTGRIMEEIDSLILGPEVIQELKQHMQ